MEFALGTFIGALVAYIWIGFHGGYAVKPREYVATRPGTGTCIKCGGQVVGRLPDRDWWECVICGPDGGGEGTDTPD